MVAAALAPKPAAVAAWDTAVRPATGGADGRPPDAAAATVLALAVPVATPRDVGTVIWLQGAKSEYSGYSVCSTGSTSVLVHWQRVLFVRLQCRTATWWRKQQGSAATGRRE